MKYAQIEPRQSLRRGMHSLLWRGVPALLTGAFLLNACVSNNHEAALTKELRHWDIIAVDASGLDHTAPTPAENRIWAQQLGPGRASRAVAMVTIAMFDAANAVRGGYKSYTGLARAPAGTSVEAAVAQAAHDTLVALFSAQAATFNAELQLSLAAIGDSQGKRDGIALGKQAAANILAFRQNDGSEKTDPTMGVTFIPSEDAGKWRVDPISNKAVALGAYWGQVRPFALQSSSQFRAPAPPSMYSAEYTAAYNEVKSLGGDGVHTPTQRTQEQTNIGIYWAYDGTPSLCAPIRLYNQIVLHIAEQQGTEGMELARLLALTSAAMADAAIGIWESKFYYQSWRPVCGIRESDAGTGPLGLGDSNVDTAGDVNWMPLGAPASNLSGPNFTPPFPSYPSGHGGFGGALFEILRKFYGTDNIAFTFTSDEFNGKTRDSLGNVRALMPRSFNTFSQAEEENGQSRIYLGIHWNFDKTAAIFMGRQVADYVFRNFFAPSN